MKQRLRQERYYEQWLYRRLANLMLPRRIDLRGISGHERVAHLARQTADCHCAAKGGAAIDISLPLAAQPPGAPAQAHVSPKRVLLVADQPTSVLQLRALLTFAGHSTCVCRTVSDAVLALKSVALDIAVIDLGMATNGTRLTSLEFGLVARASNESLLIGVVLRDGHAPLDNEDMRQHGIDFIIEKPYGANAVRTAIASATARSDLMG